MTVHALFRAFIGKKIETFADIGCQCHKHESGA